MALGLWVLPWAAEERQKLKTDMIRLFAQRKPSVPRVTSLKMEMMKSKQLFKC